jgi:pilus assembly protein Flp/PilA
MVTSGRRLAFGLGPGASILNRSNNMTNLIRFLKDDSGATAIEYGLLASLIAVALITAVQTLGTTLTSKFSDITSAIKDAGT